MSGLEPLKLYSVSILLDLKEMDCAFNHEIMISQFILNPKQTTKILPDHLSKLISKQLQIQGIHISANKVISTLENNKESEIYSFFTKEPSVGLPIRRDSTEAKMVIDSDAN